MAQERERMLSLSGEFLVAGELLRRGVSVAIPYGNALIGELVAKSEKVITSFEIRTTRDSKWTIGNELPKPNDSIWVFVCLPRDRSQGEFYILTGAELHAILKPKHDAFMESKKGRILIESAREHSVDREEIDGHNAAWEKVTTALGLPRGDWSHT